MYVGLLVHDSADSISSHGPGELEASATFLAHLYSSLNRNRVSVCLHADRALVWEGKARRSRRTYDFPSYVVSLYKRSFVILTDATSNSCIISYITILHSDINSCNSI
jgi:hypothetical protein